MQICSPDRARSVEDPPARIVADARLDDRDGLIAAIAREDIDSSANDAELIVAAWEKWGESCPKHLIGDYAFAIHCAATDSLFCARDHVGARPLYYHSSSERFAFASDPNGILALADVGSGLDDEIVLLALSSNGKPPVDRSWHREIARLAPGHSLRATPDGVQIERYWRPGDVAPIRLERPEDYAVELRSIMCAAVTDRLRGARRVGVHLSGGLDSSAIAALAVARLRDWGASDPVGFTWQTLDPDAPSGTEPAWCEAIRAHLDLPLIAPKPDADTVVRLLRRDITRWPDPAELINEAPVQREAERLGVDVMLSGWGGDQGASYNGRGLAADLFAHGRWFAMWESFGPGSFLYKLRRVGGAIRDSVIDRLPSQRERSGGFASAELRQRARAIALPPVRGTSVKQRMCDMFEDGSITARLEAWAASGARMGIEYRYPLLDRRVLDFCYAIPPTVFVRHGVTRWLMRTAMADLLPRDILERTSKSEPLRVAEAAPALLEAFVRFTPMIERCRERIARARYVDVDGLLRWLRRPRDDVRGQWRGRVAIQLLDFPPDERDDTVSKPELALATQSRFPEKP
jgi:asparagine synthase (glutamine-hydrolysing)